MEPAPGPVWGSRDPALGLAIGVLLLASVLATSCVTPSPRTFAATSEIRSGARVELGQVASSADLTNGDELAGMLRSALAEALAKGEIAWSGDPGQDRYRLDAQVVEYEAGNAFKRWLAPGYGSTVLHVRGELVDPLSGEVVARIDHERSVAFGGAYTIGAWRTVFGTVAKDVTRELEIRLKGTGFVVSLKPWSSRMPEVPAASRALELRLGDVEDLREDRARIGQREALGVSMGDVYLSRNVADFVRETIVDELRAAGHVVDGTGPGRELRVQLREFRVHTESTPLYWDVIGRISIAVGFATPAAAGPLHDHACEARQRTWVWPTVAVVEKTLDSCRQQLMASLRRDPLWSEQP